VARERDEESGALYCGSTRGGTASATEFTSDTFQTCSRMRQSARRLQYDGTIPKPHVWRHSLYGTLSGPISENERSSGKCRSVVQGGHERSWSTKGGRGPHGPPGPLRSTLIHHESHFNFIKIHLLSHFSVHIRHFGNIPMYSTEFGELAHKEQIKDGWRQSNKNDATRQIVHSYSRQHAIRIRLLNLESLRRRGADLSADVLKHLEGTTSAENQAGRP